MYYAIHCQSYPGSRPDVYTFTGVDDPEERIAMSNIVISLGGTVIEDDEFNTDAFDWDRITHVICAARPNKGIKRCPKVLMCLSWGFHMARSTFLLHPSYLIESKRVGR